MQRLRVILVLAFLLAGVACSGCSDDDPAGPGPTWRIVFFDPFDGSTLNTITWEQILPIPASYSLTGSGELEITGGPVNDSAAFIYSAAVTGSAIRFTTKFRATLPDPIDDDVEALILMNTDGTFDNGYGLLLESGHVGSSRDYRLSILKLVSGQEEELTNESMGGTQPQVTAGNDYVLEGVNDGGTITFSIKDGTGTLLKSVSAVDATYTGGKFGFAADVNVDVTPYSMFFDYAQIERRE